MLSVCNCFLCAEHQHKEKRAQKSKEFACAADEDSPPEIYTYIIDHNHDIMRIFMHVQASTSIVRHSM